MSFFSSLVGLGQPAEVLVYIKDEGQRRHVSVNTGPKDKFESLPLFFDGESVTGRVG